MYFKQSDYGTTSNDGKKTRIKKDMESKLNGKRKDRYK